LSERYVIYPLLNKEKRFLRDLFLSLNYYSQIYFIGLFYNKPQVLSVFFWKNTLIKWVSLALQKRKWVFFPAGKSPFTFAKKFSIRLRKTFL